MRAEAALEAKQMLMKAQEEHAAKEAALKSKAAEEKAAVERRVKGEVEEKVSVYVGVGW